MDCVPRPTIISTAILKTSALRNRPCLLGWCRPRRALRRHIISGAQKRSRLVLKAMADTGVISRSRAASVHLARPSVRASNVPTGSYFADWVTPYAQQAQDPDFGEVKVETTLD